MSNSYIGLNDLPDEIIMFIFRKLNNVDILYAIQGVNQRLNTIIHDPIFTNNLTFVQWLPHRFIDVLSSDVILNRFCLQILPDIHHQIEWLDLESSSMKRVLSAATYPNLHTFGLYNISEESARELFADEVLVSGIFKNQITTLLITMDHQDDYYIATSSSVANIFNKIFTIFTNLISVVIDGSSYTTCLRFNFEEELFFSNFRSSTLSELHINLDTFEDLLYLLDGRFSQLHTLHVDLISMDYLMMTQNQSALPTLQCFSLTCHNSIDDYNRTVIPLLRRMSNLEELRLCLTIKVYGPFIDGSHLKSNIINHLPRLKEFTFSICSFTLHCNEMNWCSSEDIQRTFVDFPYNNNIICNINHCSERKNCLCHIYSYPFSFQYYNTVTNNFPGGIFYSVRLVLLADRRPFEHEFFLRIQQSFPFMESLTVRNYKPQHHKPSYDANNDYRNFHPIQYPYLIELSLYRAHDDYIEQFLFHTKTYLQNQIKLHVDYERLERVTHNFTRDATRINCTKISKLHLYGRINSAISLKDYFPCAKICYPLYSL